MHELKKLFHEENFVADTVAQINKDLLGLANSGIDTNRFEANKSILENLVVELTVILHNLATRIPEQLSQFVYHVDLGENKYFDCLQKDMTLHDLAYKIIEREAQKVYFKRTFK